MSNNSSLLLTALGLQYDLRSAVLSTDQNNQSMITLQRCRPGWYMLELKANLPSVRVVSQVQFGQQPVCSLPILSGRMCKRIIWLNGHRSALSIHLGVTLTAEPLEHVRLARVTERFAKQRMLKRLYADDPIYRLKFNQEKARSFKHPTPDLTQKLKNALNSFMIRTSSSKDKESKATAQSLWLDYCAVFEHNQASERYKKWLQDYGTSVPANHPHVSNSLDACLPSIAVVMPVYNANPEWLRDAVQSVLGQDYANWTLIIVDDASTNKEVQKTLRKVAQLDPRIQVVFRTENGHISQASNTALDQVKSDWVALLDHDDLLAEHALMWVADAIVNNPNIRMIYSDEDKVDEEGQRSDPYFKPDWNPDLFYSQNMFSHLGVYHTALIRAVGGFRQGFEGSQDYDLALRCIEQIQPMQIYHIPKVLYHWRIHAQSTAHSSEAKPYAVLAGVLALSEHFQRRNIPVRVEALDFGYRVHYPLPNHLPLVSLIIPTRNGFHLLKNCIDSLLNKTSYPSFEIIIVDNGSDEPTTLRYLQELTKNARIRVLRDDGPFNYSALNNRAVTLARGDIIGLLNNDLEVISADWLSEMVSHVLRPEIGVVGAKLLYSDDSVQHAGVILGIHGIAGHVHRFLPKGASGYCGRAHLTQSFSAVTAACMLVRKPIYEDLGGLNEQELQVACNDVDFCLRVQEAGFRNLWTPFALLYHYESVSRGFDDTPEKLARSAQEIAYMKQRWGHLLLCDPAYNPNLSLENEDFGLAWPPR